MLELDPAAVAQHPEGLSDVVAPAEEGSHDHAQRRVAELEALAAISEAVSESLYLEESLEAIVKTDSTIAIIDITGVPTVDTLVAQHLLKTVAAARLMGADCIISGIRPQIAQTVVHLGLDLSDVTTKASLADAVSVALERTGFAITRRRGAPTA